MPISFFFIFSFFRCKMHHHHCIMHHWNWSIEDCCYFSAFFPSFSLCCI
jgi:hypothetical protein